MVSVPYRGATFLNVDGDMKIKLNMDSFRPLSGSYISQSARDIMSVPFCFSSFRPLSGSYISQ